MRAAREGGDFKAHLQAALEAAPTAAQDDLTRAAHRVVDVAAELPPQLGCWFANLAGALAESGADVDGIPVIERLSGVSSGALTFAEAWGPHVPAAEDGPTPDIYRETQAILGDRTRIAMQCWYALPQFASAACTLLSLSPATRAAVDDTDELVDRAAAHCPQLDYVRDLRRVLDGEQLLILDRTTRQGWGVEIHGVGDNFQLHTLLAAVLVPDHLPGRPVDPRHVDAFTTGESSPMTPIVTGWWNLVDVNGEWIWNEGVPADIPLFGDSRVLVLDPPSYERSWSPGRRFPLMPATLTLTATYDPADLTAWWPTLKPPAR
ncbi:hypothetical protein GCM10010468_54230 [Actinocorallia longicatena]|uniref:Uncharacterized protein n=1 Tax=Actinocorallia longicatena TaxID=111803 RepID=A0ABP6QFW8_9ACTN